MSAMDYTKSIRPGEHAVFNPEKIYISSFGDAVRHIHFYVIPRTHDMPADALSILRQLFDGRWACSDDEAAEVATRM